MTKASPVANDDAPTVPDEARYFNRELSWLAFNRRVMEEACNGAHPLLERLRFLSISGSNFDEFFMVRVAGLVNQQLQHIEARSTDGLTPSQQLAAIIEEAADLVDSQQAVWNDILDELVTAVIDVLDAEEIEGVTFEWLEKHFRATGRPVESIENSKAVVSNINAIPEPAQRAMLDAALAAPDRTHAELDAPAHAWAQGNVGYDSPLRIFADVRDPSAALADPLLVQRNGAWVDSLSALMARRPGVILFAAGVGHFVGPGSVIDLLQKRGVRVERVQEITGKDVVAEGLDCSGFVSPAGYVKEGFELKAAIKFAELWDSINGKGSWAANPWVWVVEFRRAQS